MTPRKRLNLFQNNKVATHFILDLFGCTNPHIDNIAYVLTTLQKAVERFNMNKIDQLWHKFEPEGLTVVFLLKESHLSFHNFVHQRKVIIDLCTCSNAANFNELEGYFIDAFGAESSRVWVIDRGSNQ